MNKPKISQRRIFAAFAVAILADAIQFPATAAAASGIFAVPSEAADLFVDCVVAVITSALLGFHWLLLPTMMIEAIPGLDMLPTWTGCVALVVRQRLKEPQSQPQPASPIIDI
jgi:hypothetical protein